MFRAVLFAAVFFFCTAVFAQRWEIPDSVEVLSVKYRNAVAKGEKAAAIEILRQIVAILPEDSDWQLNLAEDLLKAGRAVEARNEFDRVLEIEPEFLKAAIGIARTYAVQKKLQHAKDDMFKAARKGYPVARMLRERELKACFSDSRFVLKLLEADRPEVVKVRDAFKNPLRRPVKDKVEEGNGEKKPEKLPEARQKEIVEDGKTNLAVAQEEIKRGETEKALDFYKKVMDCCAKKPLFTEEKYIRELEQMQEIARETLYPSIETLLRNKTIRKAADILDKLSSVVEERDRAKARELNAQLLATVREALESKDELLKERIKDIDRKRAEVFRTVEILDEFDREVRPKLTLRGTITGKLAGRSFAFIDIISADGPGRVVVCEGDKVAALDLHVLQIMEDSIMFRYKGVQVGLELGGGVAMAAPVKAVKQS